MAGVDALAGRPVAARARARRLGPLRRPPPRPQTDEWTHGDHRRRGDVDVRVRRRRRVAGRRHDARRAARPRRTCAARTRRDPTTWETLVAEGAAVLSSRPSRATRCGSWRRSEAVDAVRRYAADGTPRGSVDGLRRPRRRGRVGRRPGDRAGVRRRRLVRRADHRLERLRRRHGASAWFPARRRRRRSCRRCSSARSTTRRSTAPRSGCSSSTATTSCRGRHARHPQRLRRLRHRRDTDLVAADRRLVRGRWGVRHRRSARRSRARRGLAPRRTAGHQAERLRRLPRRRRLARRDRPRQPRSPRHPRALQRRAARRCRADPASGPLPGGVVRRAAARHGPLPAVPHRQAVDRRVRRSRRRRGVRAGCTPTRPTTGSSTAPATPATLFTTAEGDTRVDPLHARKMAALLQATVDVPGRAADPAVAGGPRRPRRRQAGRQAGRRAGRRADVPGRPARPCPTG